MSRQNIVLKQNETARLSPTTSIQDAVITYSSSNPTAISVSSGGLITALINPSQPVAATILSKDEYGILLGNVTVFVIPQSMEKSAIKQPSRSFLTSKFIKNGQSTTFTVDKGEGAHVGVTYSASSNNVISISESTGIIISLTAVTEPQYIYVFAKDTATGVSLSSELVVVVPEDVNIADIKSDAKITVI